MVEEEEVTVRDRQRFEDALLLALKMKEGAKARNTGGLSSLENSKKDSSLDPLEGTHADRWILAQGNPFQTSYFQNCATIDLCCSNFVVICYSSNRKLIIIYSICSSAVRGLSLLGM